jgi:hypothetical protein
MCRRSANLISAFCDGDGRGERWQPFVRVRSFGDVKVKGELHPFVDTVYWTILVLGSFAFYYYYFSSEKRVSRRGESPGNHNHDLMNTITNKARYDTTLVVRQSKWSPEPAQTLREAKADPKIANLHLLGISFTEDILQALTELLVSERRRTCKKRAHVYFRQCHTMGLDCGRLGKALSNQVTELFLEETPEVLDSILAACPNTKVPQRLIIRQQRQVLSESQCLGLGRRLVNSYQHIQELSLKGTTVESPALLAPGIGACRSLEKLVLADITFCNQPQSALADLVVSRMDEYGVGAVLQLLVASNSRLKSLDLSNLHLQDEHVVILASALTRTNENNTTTTNHNSTLEQLNLSFNEIGCDGIVQFSRYLPEMRALKKLSLKPNPWAEGGGKAILEGMRQNVSIEYLDSLLFLPQAPLLRYYTALNRGGRRILLSQHSSRVVPLGLWPLLLERTWKIHYAAETNAKEREAKLDALFYLLKNGPVLLFSKR